MSNQHFLILSLGFAVGFVASACVTDMPSPKHCRYAQGDQTCAERYDGARPFCTAAACDGSSEGFYGCVAERPSDDCYYPCGDDNDTTVDDGCLIAGDGDGDDDGDKTDGDVTGGDGDADTPCMGAADCAEGTAPFCDLVTGQCVGCDGTEDPDGACAGLESQLPVCFADACVACSEDKPDTCIEDTPICDTQSNACVGCSDHDQCPDSACNLAAGSCFDPQVVLHVHGHDTNCDAADGTEAMPYCELGDALFDAAAQTLIILHEQEDPYVESNTISKSIALLAAEGEHPVLTKTGGKAPISVTPSGLLFLRGVDIVGTQNNGLGLAINGGQAWVSQSKIANNTGGGILVEGGGALTLENSFVGGNILKKAVVEVIDGEVSVVYSTLVAGAGNDSRAFVCTEQSNSTIRNSVVVSLSAKPEIECANVQTVDSFTEVGAGMTFDEDSDWFMDLGEGDLHLAPNNYPDLIATAATWHTGDPPTDIDGAPRPTADATSDFAGADRLP